jgi:hypothetical protein
MTSDEFFQLLTRFARRPTPSLEGRHVYVWAGQTSILSAKIPRGQITVLDLHALCKTLERTPNTTEAARTVFAEAISKWLEKEMPEDDKQRVLVITGCDVLLRYQIPPSPFVQIASEKRLIVFTVPPEERQYKPTRPLPNYVHLEPSATFTYLKLHTTENGIIGE